MAESSLPNKMGRGVLKSTVLQMTSQTSELNVTPPISELAFKQGT